MRKYKECNLLNLEEDFEKLRERFKNFSKLEYKNIAEAKISLKIFDKLIIELKILIEKSLREKNKIISVKALKLLAENIGSEDDLRVTTKFLTCMQDEKLLSNEEYNVFYENLNKGRWK